MCNSIYANGQIVYLGHRLVEIVKQVGFSTPAYRVKSPTNKWTPSYVVSGYFLSDKKPKHGKNVQTLSGQRGRTSEWIGLSK